MVFVVAAAWVAIGAYLRRRRPKTSIVPLEPRSTSSYLRSLLPFEKGDRLLGRDQEVGQLLVLLRSLEFRFGFLSGEAGAGKTSLLRARILPELEKEGRHVVYVPRTGNDPEAAIRKELCVSMSFPELPTEHETLGELFRKALEALPGKSLVLIVDQFEEHFVAQGAPGSKERFEKALIEISALEHRVRVLFSIRKEFVDDLLDLSKVIPSLQSTQWRLPLRNFAPGTAREVLRKVSQEENLPFSDELQDIVIVDLTRDKRVRPVEFQIVLTTLLTQGVGELSIYRTMQGAQGVIARFVSDTIEPPDLKVNEVERTVARQSLRALCNKQFTTRRPVGLTRLELLERILAEMQTSIGIPVSRTQIEVALDRVLRRLVESYILILEDRDRFNLVHDYLASPVRDATAGMETVEERANRLLEQYVEQVRADRQIVMPWKTLRFVQRFAGAESLARSDAWALLRRSRLRHYAFLGGAGLAGLALVTLMLPFGVRYPAEEQIKLSGRRFISRDGRLLVILDNNQATIMRLDRPKFELRKLSLPVKWVAPAPAGDSLLALGTDRALYRVRIEGNLKLEKLIDNVSWSEFYIRYRWAGFSSDGSWSFATSPDGRVYAWPVQGRPREIFKIVLTNERRKPVDPNKPLPKEHAWFDEPQPPVTGLTANGRWLWVVDGNGHLYVLNPSADSGTQPTAVGTLVSSNFGFEKWQVVGSPNGEWLAFTDDADLVRVVNLARNSASAPVIALRMSRHPGGLGGIWFSPDSKWLVARATFANFYTVQLIEPISAQAFPAIDLPQSSSEEGRQTVVFDAASKYIAGRAQDGQTYIWQLASPPRTNAKPGVEQRSGYEYGQNAFFCANDSRVLLSAQDGSIHSARLDHWPLEFKQIGRLAPSFVNFRMSNDQQTIFAYDSVRLAAGTCEDLRTVTEHNSNIFEIVSDGRGNLVLIGERDLLRLGRAFYLWGVPVWRIGWPELLPSLARKNE